MYCLIVSILLGIWVFHIINHSLSQSIFHTLEISQGKNFLTPQNFFGKHLDLHKMKIEIKNWNWKLKSANDIGSWKSKTWEKFGNWLMDNISNISKLLPWYTTKVCQLSIYKYWSKLIYKSLNLRASRLIFPPMQ